MRNHFTRTRMDKNKDTIGVGKDMEKSLLVGISDDAVTLGNHLDFLQLLNIQLSYDLLVPDTQINKPTQMFIPQR